MHGSRTIGVVGGVGPYAGLDLVKKVFDQTEASRDQDHLPVLLASLPEGIPDRTGFLLGEIDDNPGHAIASVIGDLANSGAEVIGIACNTAHAPRIMDVIEEEMRVHATDVHLLNMIEEVGDAIAGVYGDLARFGLLSTLGTYRSGIYQTELERRDRVLVVPDGETQALVHTAVYDPAFGIKSMSDPVSDLARDHLYEGIHHLQARSVDAIILGCTEISMAFTGEKVGDTILIDPARILGRALIREATG